MTYAAVLAAIEQMRPRGLWSIGVHTQCRRGATPITTWSLYIGGDGSDEPHMIDEVPTAQALIVLARTITSTPGHTDPESVGDPCQLS